MRCRRNERRGIEYVLLVPADQQRHPDCESTSFSELALDGNLPAHQLAEFLAECQSQPGPPVLAGAGVVDDGEFFEKPGDLIRSNADTRVYDMDHKIITGSIELSLRDKLDLALMSELYSVIKQLTDHIAELASVTEGRSKIWSDSAAKLIPALLGRRPHYVDDLAE